MEWENGTILTPSLLNDLEKRAVEQPFIVFDAVKGFTKQDIIEAINNEKLIFIKGFDGNGNLQFILLSTFSGNIFSEGYHYNINNQLQQDELRFPFWGPSSPV